MYRVSFDTQEVQTTERLDYWVDKIEAFFDIEKPAPETIRLGFEGSLSLLQCSDIIFGEVHSQGQLYTRDRKRLILDGLDHFILQIFLEGGGPIDEGPVIQPGDMLIIDMGRAHARDSWPHRTLSFVIPRDRDPELTALLDRMHEKRLPASHPFVRMIFSQMSQLWELQGDMSLAQMSTAMDSTLEFFKSVVTSDQTLDIEGRSALASPALAHSIRCYIDANLGDDLGAEALCQRFRISRAQLYRIFADHGGVMRYVQQRRLVRSYRGLSQSGLDQSVFGIAAALGFKSESHFTRVFKAEFGQTPSEVKRDGLLRSADQEGSRTLVDAWLRDLAQVR